MCMVEIRNRKTLQSKVNIFKSDVKIGDYADSLIGLSSIELFVQLTVYSKWRITQCGADDTQSGTEPWCPTMHKQKKHTKSTQLYTT